MSLTISGTTGIALPDGSVAAPSTRGQDANSGVSYGADSIKFSTGGVERMSISNSGVVGAGGGKIGKVLQSVKTDTSSTGSTTGYVLPGTDQTGSGSVFCVKIQPSANDSKILVLVDVCFSCNQIYYMDILREVSSSDTNIYRGASATNKVHHTMGGYHDADGGSTGNVSLTFKHNMHHVMSYLDSPGTTSEITYKLTFKVASGGYDVLFNKNWGDGSNDATSVRTASSITCMEVLA
tara:strand:- start:6997 stop:7707 length:711 start_codon:yes stop_codon:yes gene_type:complete